MSMTQKILDVIDELRRSGYYVPFSEPFVYRSREWERRVEEILQESTDVRLAPDPPRLLVR